MPIPTAVSIKLTGEERAVLEGWTRRWTSAQALALRARIVLVASEGLWSNGEIAEALAVSRPTVTKWRNRFAQRRLEGLADEPRPGKPRTIIDQQVEAVVTKTLESAPKNATHWSTRSMGREVGMTPDAVMRIWHAFGLQPHRQETWKLSKDPLFIEKVHDICGLYLRVSDDRRQRARTARCHLVLDNASSHKTPKVRRWLAVHPRFHLHFTQPAARGSTSSSAGSASSPPNSYAAAHTAPSTR
jgi:transposase